MTDKITYKVNDKEFYPDTPELTAGEILKEAGYDPDVFRLEYPQKGLKYEPSDIVSIENGAEFVPVSEKTDTPDKPTIYHFKVNTLELTTEKDELTVKEILGRAKLSADKYLIAEVSPKREEFSSIDALVKITDGSEFVSTPVDGPTPVS